MRLLALLCLLSAAHAADVPLPPPAQPVPAKVEIARGKFQPTVESLRHYVCPEWFRDAKLGFWGILGPQSLPEAGDWYARHMYVEGSPQYLFHLAHYGHPSQSGYKNLAAGWRLDKFDPDRLMALYKQAGAKYFVVLANHHDNWDNWNSRYHAWNSVNVGPRRDLVGEWAAATRRAGLRFGVTEHLARSYSWFNTNKGADKTGPRAGVPYDGNDKRYEDLYFPPHADTSAGYPENPPEWWPREWFWRMRDLLDTYRPDLMYSDGGVPFGDVGLSLFAHYYNANTAWHGGRLDAVYNIKSFAGGDYADGFAVRDLERGVLQGIGGAPWQTDTCIGDWFYKTGITYKPAKMVVAMLADIVAKNGNLLLNIPLKHDGSIDAGEERFLADLGAWMAANGEAIYGTRPWLVFGEGPHQSRGGHFNEGLFTSMTAADIRFTTRGGALYAIVLAPPSDGVVRIRSLAKPVGPPTNRIANLRLLGSHPAVTWSQDGEALTVRLPAGYRGDGPLVIKVAGRDLRPVVAEWFVTPTADGHLLCAAADARIHGPSPVYEQDGAKDQIGYWADAKDYVEWPLAIERPGVYAVRVTYSCAAGAEGSAFRVVAGDQAVAGRSASTGSWAAYRTDELGRVKLGAGRVALAVKPLADPPWRVIGLRSVELRPVE
ncbi:MAG: alpha-L-fucosidase [Armatimonadetes bacterium]|nr:alpha-L-fucosidase [Armatimonadota bacterium]